ncbi:MAG: hypothetical protein LUQ24_08825 [Methanobacterium sp.]|nr:hypothetical protein [Methanobacterium sp.]
MFKIDIQNREQGRTEKTKDIVSTVNKEENTAEEEENKDEISTADNSDKEREEKEKIETCYFCLQKFDINKDDLSHYKYGKFPMCDYCSQFYGFYEEKK